MDTLLFAKIGPFDSPLDLSACLTLGGAILVFTWWLLTALASDDLEQGNDWRYDVSRMNELRRIDPIYRNLFPLVQLLARFNRSTFADSLPIMNREIQASGLPRYWLAEEYLAKLELTALAASPIIALICVQIMGTPGLVLAVVGTVLLGWILRRGLANQARDRLRAIKRRMPFLLDLLTLLMEAGSTFVLALKQGVKEFEGHPVSQEFGRVLSDMNMGKSRVEAFDALKERLQDDEVTSIVGSILQGEMLGTPLAQVFRTQADVLRIKRTQRAETIAGEAGVNMLLPGVMIMMSTVVVILGPFLLNFLFSGFTL